MTALGSLAIAHEPECVLNDATNIVAPAAGPALASRTIAASVNSDPSVGARPIGNRNAESLTSLLMVVEQFARLWGLT